MRTPRRGKGARSRLSLLLLLGWGWGAAPAESQWLSPPGEGWAEVSFFYHDTRKTFNENARERSIFADGRAITRSVFLTAVAGVWRGVDVWVQAPFHSLRFDDAGGDRVSRGVGDPRGFVRVGTELFDAVPDWPIALRGGVKLDGGSFDVDAEIIPLGEGQRDWEILLELGHSFYPRSLWTSGWAGHRWREANHEARRRPGNEWFWLWSLGGTLGPAGWKVSLEGLEGDAWTIQSLQLPSTRRSLTQAFFELNREIGPGHLSAGIRRPFSGRNLPAGTALTAGYFVRFGGE